MIDSGHCQGLVNCQANVFLELWIIVKLCVRVSARSDTLCCRTGASVKQQSPDWRVSHFRSQAAKARVRALSASTDEDREEFLHLARNWEALAREAAKVGPIGIEQEGFASH
jgi:hypothetical protein